MAERTVDFHIIGRGLSGRNLTRSLGRRGFEPTLGGKDYKLPRSWFVLGTRMPSDVMQEVTNDRIVSYELSGTEFVIENGNKDTKRIGGNLRGLLPPYSTIMIDDKGLKDFYREETIQYEDTDAGARVSSVTPTASGKLRVKYVNGHSVVAHTVVDASGSRSEVLRAAGVLQDNPIVMWIHGVRFEGEFDPEKMIFPLSNKTGRVSWLTPISPTVGDLLAADYCKLSDYPHLKETEFPKALENLRRFCESKGICRIDKTIHPITGKVRVVPTKKPVHVLPLYSVGDAAGQACPNMAEGVTVALRQSEILANKLPNTNPAEYHDDWRRKNPEYPYNLALAFLYRRIENPEPGKNSAIYQTILENASPSEQLRFMRERRIGLRDVPFFLRAALLNPNIIPNAIGTMGRSQLLWSSRVQQTLW